MRMPMYFFLVIAFPTKGKTGLDEWLLPGEPPRLLTSLFIAIFIFLSSKAVKHSTFSLSVMGFGQELFYFIRWDSKRDPCCNF